MELNTFRKLSYGVYVITTWNDGKPTGCTVNSIMQITSESPTIAVSVNHSNFTNECMAKTGKFAVSILSEKTDPSIIGNFGFQSGRDVDKFANINYALKANLPVLNDGCGYVVCDIIDKMETDTHTVFLGKVADAGILSEETPMSYAYYHQVIRGKSPKAAPTYIPEN